MIQTTVKNQPKTSGTEGQNQLTTQSNQIKKQLIPFEIQQTKKQPISLYQAIPTDKRLDLNIFLQAKVVILVASSLMFLGFNRAMVASVVNSYTTKQFEKLFNFQLNTITTKAVLAGITPLGAFFGTICCSFLIKTYSARQILLNASLLAIICTVTTMYTDIIILMIFKFMTGLSTGTFVAIIPSYIRQITSKNIAPYFGTAPVINESLGGLFAFIMGFVLYQSTESVRDTWIIMCGLNIIPLVLIIITIQIDYIYQSPIFLLRNGLKSEAEKIYSIIYKPEFVHRIVVEKQLQIKRFYFTQLKSIFPRGKNGFLNRKDILIGIHLPILRKMTGVLIIVLSSGSMLKSIHPQFERKAPIFISLVYVTSCFLSNVVVKTLSRRTAFQMGTISICICNLILSICYILQANAIVVLVFKLILLYMYGMTLGPLVWAYLPQVVPARIIPLAQCMNWLIDCFTLPLPGVIIAHHGNPWPLFFVFFLWDFISIGVNHFIIVQTKKKSLNEILDKLDKKD